MRKILLLTMVLVLAVGMVFAWAVDKTVPQKPASTTATAPVTGDTPQNLDKSSTEGPVSVINKTNDQISKEEVIQKEAAEQAKLAQENAADQQELAEKAEIAQKQAALNESIPDKQRKEARLEEARRQLDQENPPVISDVQDFTGGPETFTGSLGEFSNYSGDDGTTNWIYYSSDGNPSGCARHSYGYASPTENDFLISNGFYTIPGGTGISLFWDQKDTYPTDYDLHQVGISTDFAGDPTTATWTWLYNGVAATTWETIVIPLDSYIGQSVVIGFNYQGYNADAWAVDNVTIGTYPPVGRCCDNTDPYNPVCYDNITLDDCTTLYSGVWTIGLDCSTPCVARPANDECVDAIAIGDGSYTVMTQLATDSGIGTHSIYKDVFYCFTAPVSGTADISLCGTTFDTKLAVWDGCACPPTTELGYNDDGCSSPDYTLASRLLVDVVQGQTYLIQAGSYSSTGFGTIYLDVATYSTGRCCYGDPYAPSCVDGVTEDDCTNIYAGSFLIGGNCIDNPCPAIPANDLCMNAQAIPGPYSPGVVVSGTTTLATGDNIGTCGTTGNSNPGVWYSVTGTGNSLTADLCNGNTSWDSKIQVWCNSCDYPMCVGGNDDFCGLQSSLTWCTESGVEYLILVYQYGSTGGSFDLTITDDGVACANPPVCTPQEGACCYGDPLAPTCVDGVTEEECNTTYSGYSWVESALCTDDPSPCPALQPGDNCGAPIVIASLPFTDVGQYTCGRGNDYDNTCLGYYDGGEDIIYEFTLAAPADIQVQLNPNTTTYTGVLLDDACPADPSACIAYSTSYSAIPHGFSVSLAAGTYYIMVDTWPAPDCIPDFDIYVGPPPTGRCCDYSSDPYNPVCTDGVTEPNCQATGQVWTEGIDCTVDCALPPANDDCSTAEAITGPYPVTGSASNIAGQNADCPSLLNWNAIWYSLELPYDLNYITITLCPEYTDLADAGIILMNDCACDDYLGATSYVWPYVCENGHNGVQLHFDAVPGGMTWYWPAYAIDAAGHGVDFTYEIDITPPPTGRCCDYSADPNNPTCTADVEEADCQAAGQIWTEGLDCTEGCPLPPANDECANAEDLGGTFPIIGSGSSVLGQNVDCPGVLDWNAVWYTFDLPYGYNNVTIHLCPTSANLSTAGIVLMNDCECDDYLLTTTYTFTYGVCEGGWTGIDLYFEGVPAGTWYWPEYGVDGSGNGLDFTFEIDVEESPTGRCCDYTVPATPVCTDDTYEPDCAGPAFVWAEGLNCTDDPCEPAMEGDFCGNAFVVGALPYNTTGNTCTFHDNCTLTGEYDNADVMYEWTVPTEYVYTVSLCGSSYDTKLGIFLDECCTGAGTEYAYNDDFCGLQSEITMVFIPGTYYVVVDGFGSGCGDYVLNITEVGPPPVGRCCYGDIYNLDCVDNVTQYECLATYESTAWLEGADCSSDPCPANPHFGVSPTELTGHVDEVGQVFTDNLAITNTGSGPLTFNASVSIDPPAMANVDPADISHTTLSSIDMLATRKPSNYAPNTPDPNMILQGGDVIGSATVIPAIPYNDNGTTTGYTNDYDEVCPYTGSTAPDVVYSYAPAANEWINVDLYGSAYDTKLYIYEDAVGNLVACNDDYYSDFTSALFNVGITTGHTYYIIVDGYGTANGAYVINVTMGTQPPVGRCCDYTDPYNPVCTDNVYEADCAGSWTVGLDCSTPCPGTPQCPSDALFGQNPNLPNEAWSFAFDDADNGYVCYENFGGIFGTIESITFWGIGINLTTYLDCDAGGNFQVIFYEDNGGVPGAVVASYDVVPTVTPTGLIFNNGVAEVQMMQYDVSFAPVSLTAGWVSIQNVDVDGCTFAWAQSFTGDGHAFQNTVDLLYDLAMCLEGTYIAPWLTIDTNSGTMNPGDPAINIGVSMDATTLDCGEYHGAINFTTNDPVISSFSVPVTFTVCNLGFAYLPGDANMYNGAWPPAVIGSDVTYLVNYFRGLVTNPACLIGGFYCAADVNNSCTVIGSDVTRLVSYFRGQGIIEYCVDYEPLWHNSGELPADPPAGWPNCEALPVVNKVIPGANSSK